MLIDSLVFEKKNKQFYDLVKNIPTFFKAGVGEEIYQQSVTTLTIDSISWGGFIIEQDAVTPDQRLLSCL